jgi:hypothetical protein
LTIAVALSLFAPSAAMAAAAAPMKTSLATRAEISGCLNQVFTFYLPIEWLDAVARRRMSELS